MPVMLAKAGWPVPDSPSPQPPAREAIAGSPRDRLYGAAQGRGIDDFESAAWDGAADGDFVPIEREHCPATELPIVRHEGDIGAGPVLGPEAAVGSDANGPRRGELRRD